MTFSELPKEYQELEQGFGLKADLDHHFDNLCMRFLYQHTPQGHDFWLQCARAITNEDLPKIPE